MKQNEHTLEQICADLCSREQKRGSIGLLGEKVLHAGLKFYFEPNSDFHEVKINGFVADICNAEGIIEIQTRSLGKLKRKLEVFFAERACYNCLSHCAYQILMLGGRRDRYCDRQAEISQNRQCLGFVQGIVSIAVFFDAS